MPHRQIGNLVGPALIPVIAAQTLHEATDGVDAKKGDRVEVAPVCAAVLLHRRRAYSVTSEPPRRRGRRRTSSTYERRDMTARED